MLLNVVSWRGPPSLLPTPPQVRGPSQSLSKLSLDVEGRLVALCWTHATAAGVLLGLAIAVAAAFDPARSYGLTSSRGGNLPLSVLLVVKCTSVGLVAASLLVSMRVRPRPFS